MHFSKVVEYYAVDYGVEAPQVQCLVRLPDPDEILARFLRCSACLQFDYPPMSLCTKGHPICARCFSDEDLSFCSFMDEERNVCQSSFLKNIPMRLYEYLHEKSTFFCPNKVVGCPEAMQGSELKNHCKVDCEFRNLSSCFFTGCRSMKAAKLAGYENHLVDDHKTEQIFDSFAPISIKYDESFKNGNTQVPIIISCHDAKIMVIMHTFDNRIAMWTTIISKPQGSSFKATYTIKFNEQTAAKMASDKTSRTIFHEVHMPHVPLQDIIDLSECADFAKQVIETKFVKKDTRSGKTTWDFSIHIEPV